MKNIFSSDKISKFFSLLNSSERVVILSHTNPDGDAIGSSLGLLRGLRSRFPDKKFRIYVPNEMPSTLRFLDTNRDVEVWAASTNESTAFIAAADLVIMSDFNDPHRLEGMGGALEKNFFAPRVLIDHHLSPKSYDVNFHDASASSASLLAYYLLEAMEIKLTAEIAEPLYAGMMTDTGGFMFSNLNAELYSAVAEIARTGVNLVRVNREILNTQSEDRVRLTSYLLSNNMTLDKEHRSAYITLSQEEKLQYNYKTGDTEGLVNVPQTIEGIDFSTLLIENKDHIKLSLRSLSDIDVNAIANEHFNGGGHKNAAGGKFYGTMEEAVEVLKTIIEKL
ncbi:MAG: DHH family phosphoesterase [Rikenellaceae bacterium]